LQLLLAELLGVDHAWCSEFEGRQLLASLSSRPQFFPLLHLRLPQRGYRAQFQRPLVAMMKTKQVTIHWKREELGVSTRTHLLSCARRIEYNALEITR